MPDSLPLLPRARIRSGKHFERAYRRGSRARASQLLVVAVSNDLGYSRMGLSVGKRIWKLAHNRNRVRRLFREAFRQTYPELPTGVDLILIPAQARLEPDLEQLKTELVHLAHKAYARFRSKEAQTQ